MPLTVARNNFFQLSLVFIVGITAGLLLPDFLIVPATSNRQFTERSEFPLISPLLLCGDQNDHATPRLNPVYQRTQRVVDSVIGRGWVKDVGVYVRVVDTGEWFGINEDVKFTPGSLLKIPLLMSYLREAEINPDVLKTEYAYTYKYDEDEDQYFRPPHPITPGKKYPVYQLLTSMITESDNDAAQVLLDHVNKKRLNDIYANLRFTPPASKDAIDFLSPKDFGYFLRELYNASYMTREMSQKALSLMTLTIFNAGLASGVPQDVVVAHKFGERTTIQNGETVNELHDCGIVYVPNRPYLVCVMTRGHSMPDLADAIAKVSRAVYKGMEKLD